VCFFKSEKDITANIEEGLGASKFGDMIFNHFSHRLKAIHIFCTTLIISNNPKLPCIKAVRYYSIKTHPGISQVPQITSTQKPYENHNA
jgi:hypothetical protein